MNSKNKPNSDLDNVLIEKYFPDLAKIKIIEKEVSDQTIQENWAKLESKIRTAKKRRITYRVSAIAACLMALIVSGVLYTYNFPIQKIDHNQDMLNVLHEMQNESNNIQVIIDGKEKVTIDKDAMIEQESDGSIIINQKKKVEGNQTASEYIHLIVPNGKRSSLVLADGTKIWINSGTKLIYPSQFNKEKREIFVDGEIYLEVAKNESQPFIVHFNELDVKVLGTAFNVTAYHADKFANVVLVSGKVEVTSKKEKKTTALLPNNCYHMEDGVVSVEKVNVHNYICWKDGIMKLNQNLLGDIFTRLSRYYNVKIIYDDAYSSIRYKGKLSLDDNIEKVLYNISLTEPLKYTRKDNVITIKNNN